MSGLGPNEFMKTAGPALTTASDCRRITFSNNEGSGMPWERGATYKTLDGLTGA